MAKYKEWLTEEGLLKLEGMARDGLTNEQIAHTIRVNPDTLYTWIRKYSEISEALKKGKDVIDRKVENSLLDRAMGTSTTVTTYAMVKVDDEVLKVRRFNFLNEYKLDHPDLSKKQLAMVAIDKVPTYERIPIKEVHNELPPDTSAAIFWLKNRKPDIYRDQSFKNLNEANTRKATAEAKIAEAKAIDVSNGTDQQMESIDKLLSTITSEVEQDGESD
ncbi:helix-turn-helix domain-containing protein [Companilactobacillus allii]|uniref:Transposase n=1 Tax=Companilactobacillus allii TaxID=1847728 RepID=A0A1P8Q2K7_9LACO|nr:helix-turn-helix domain-containing protein [Companilactobacillus allii]APX72071.1 hypothetical protein BTM29_05615 [Companilactobacillus allii]USQ69164.1 helix-turn-helix domain-containing protein [Companilactobacillus allii]